MKALLLVACAVTAAAGCASEPSAAVRVPAHRASAEGEKAGDSMAPSNAPSADPTTTVAPPTTTTTAVTTTTTQALARTTTTVRATQLAPVQHGSGDCGGSLPPCWVMRAESGGNIRAVNYGGCGGRGCYGKWQFDPRTSQSMGYPGTMDQYDEAIQDEAARTLWAGGRGCAAWAACA